MAQVEVTEGKMQSQELCVVELTTYVSVTTLKEHALGSQLGPERHCPSRANELWNDLLHSVTVATAN